MNPMKLQSVIIVLITVWFLTVVTEVYAEAPGLATRSFRTEQCTQRSKFDMSMCVRNATNALRESDFTNELKIEDWWVSGKTPSYSAMVNIYAIENTSERLVVIIVAGPNANTAWEKADTIRTRLMELLLMTCTLSGHAAGWEGIEIFNPSSAEVLYNIPLDRNRRYRLTLPAGKYIVKPTTNAKIDAIVPERNITCQEGESYTINF